MSIVSCCYFSFYYIVIIQTHYIHALIAAPPMRKRLRNERFVHFGCAFFIMVWYLYIRWTSDSRHSGLMASERRTTNAEVVEKPALCLFWRYVMLFACLYVRALLSERLTESDPDEVGAVNHHCGSGCKTSTLLLLKVLCSVYVFMFVRCWANDS